MDKRDQPKKQIILLTTVGKLQEVLEEEIAAGRNPKTPEDWQRIVNLMLAYHMVDEAIPVEGEDPIGQLKKAVPEINIKNIREL